MKEDQNDGSPRSARGGSKQDKQLRRLMVAAKANKVTFLGFGVQGVGFRVWGLGIKFSLI